MLRSAFPGRSGPRSRTNQAFSPLLSSGWPGIIGDFDDFLTVPERFRSSRHATAFGQGLADLLVVGVFVEHPAERLLGEGEVPAGSEQGELAPAFLDRQAQFDGPLQDLLGVSDPPLPASHLDQAEPGAGPARVLGDEKIESAFGVVETPGGDRSLGQPEPDPAFDSGAERRPISPSTIRRIGASQGQ